MIELALNFKVLFSVFLVDEVIYLVVNAKDWDLEGLPYTHKCH